MDWFHLCWCKAHLFMYKKKPRSDIQLLRTLCNQRKKKHSRRDKLLDKLVRLLCFCQILSRGDHTLLHAGRLYVATSTTAAAGQLHRGQGDGAVFVHVDDFHHFHACRLATVGLEVRRDRVFQPNVVSELQIWGYRWGNSHWKVMHRQDWYGLPRLLPSPLNIKQITCSWPTSGGVWATGCLVWERQKKD